LQEFAGMQDCILVAAQPHWPWMSFFKKKLARTLPERPIIQEDSTPPKMLPID
jgi:hypothetical protein